MPHTIEGYFNCSSNGILSMSGVDKIIKYIDGQFICGPIPDRDTSVVLTNTTHLLGVLLIKGVTRVRIDYEFPSRLDDILNKYVGTGDILSAQDELIDAGYIDQARL